MVPLPRQRRRGWVSAFTSSPTTRKMRATNERRKGNEQHRSSGASRWTATAGARSRHGWPPGPDALVGGPDTRGPPGPDNLVGGPPLPGAPTGSVTSRDSGEDLDHLRTAVQALQLYAEGNHDDVELAKVHKCIVALQSILADHASNKDAAMGITPALKHVRRTTGNY